MNNLNILKNNEQIESPKKNAPIVKAKEIKRPYNVSEPVPITKIFPEGEFIATPYREVFKITHKYGLNEKIGDILISDFFKFKHNFSFLFSILGKNKELINFKIEKLLFLDVESMGYKSGSGNMVFFIGLGYFENNEFVISQYFIEDPLNEMGLLYILENIFKKRPHIISYNGKSFDFYVIKNRFVLAEKFEFTLDNIMHFDLLHSARRLWRGYFRYLNLEEVEQGFLNFYRTNDDLPGYLIPVYYKNYLKFRDASILKNIFYHNLMDVKSLLGVLILQLGIINQILNGIYPKRINYVSTANLFKEIDEDIYKSLLETAYYKKKKKGKMLKPLYVLYKKEGRIDEMLEVLYKMLDSTEFDYFPYVELSKYYEHIGKEYKKAIQILEKAEEKINLLGQEKYVKYLDDIVKRKDRLKIKLKRNVVEN